MKGNNLPKRGVESSSDQDQIFGVWDGQLRDSYSFIMHAFTFCCVLPSRLPPHHHHKPTFFSSCFSLGTLHQSRHDKAKEKHSPDSDKGQNLGRIREWYWENKEGFPRLFPLLLHQVSTHCLLVWTSLTRYLQMGFEVNRCREDFGDI